MQRIFFGLNVVAVYRCTEKVQLTFSKEIHRGENIVSNKRYYGRRHRQQHSRQHNAIKHLKKTPSEESLHKL